MCMKEKNGNGSVYSIAQAIEEMKEEIGESFSLNRINLAELARRTGISRSRLRTLQKNGFRESGEKRGGTRRPSKLNGYENLINTLLREGVSNSVIVLKRLREAGFDGGQTIVKEYIAAHKGLLPARRQQTAPQGNRGRRYATAPGEAFQMDWGFTDVVDPFGNKSRVACFAMICHSCGECCIEFFPNARQENLFIGMIHAFTRMGVPEFVLTDNMKSVVIRRTSEGHPVWQKDYETFMKTIGFETKLCRPRHPFTKGAVERLIRYVKDNFLADRVFGSITDLNRQARYWCDEHNAAYRKSVDGVPGELHSRLCSEHLNMLPETDEICKYLYPERRISFDGFVNYEGRRFGVPYSYPGRTVRVSRSGDTLLILTPDTFTVLAEHNVTWSRLDSYCEDQFEPQPEEQPTVPVRVQIHQLPQYTEDLSFEKFNFDREEYE